MNLKKSFLVVAAAATVAAMGFTAYAVSAQGPNDGGKGVMGVGDFAVCSTTDYTDVAAKALGITAPELRLALVSGKSLSDVATSKNTTVDKVSEALKAAHLADIDQAVKDGLITQQQADLMKQVLSGQPVTPPAMAATQPAVPPMGNRGNGIRINIMGMMGARANLAGISAHNTIKHEVVAAKALGISCADLVKAQRTGKSIADVAADKNVPVQTVLDALVKAEKDALAQDVKEGLITQAQADARGKDINNRVLSMLSHKGRAGMMGERGNSRTFGFGMINPGQGGGILSQLFNHLRDGRGMMGGNAPQGGRGGMMGGGKAPAQPPVAPTQAK